MNKATSARVDNGTLILLNEQGLECNRFGNQFVVAGVCGEDLVTVTKYGIVDHYTIEGGTRPVRSSKNIGGKSHDAVSIQVGTDLNFSIQLANGQTDVYSNGQKIRTTGTAKVNTPTSSSSSSSASKSSSTPPPSYSSPDISDGFMAGIGQRCKMVINEQINGPWAKIVVWMAGVIGVVAGIMTFSLTECAPLPHFILLVGIPLAVFGIGYWLRHALAKCLVRTHYGLPAVILAIALCSVNPTVGLCALAGAILIWCWPIWPLLLVVACFAGVVLAALAKAAPSMDSKR